MLDEDEQIDTFSHVTTVHERTHLLVEWPIIAGLYRQYRPTVHCSNIVGKGLITTAIKLAIKLTIKLKT